MIQEIKTIKEIKNPACSKHGGEQERDRVKVVSLSHSIPLKLLGDVRRVEWKTSLSCSHAEM